MKIFIFGFWIVIQFIGFYSLDEIGPTAGNGGKSNNIVSYAVGGATWDVQL